MIKILWSKFYVNEQENVSRFLEYYVTEDTLDFEFDV